jgi:hypothetical protein
MSGTGSETASFVRGFFSCLQQQGVRAAVLHGWHGDFEGDLSDVDFVIEPEAFRQLPRLIEDWCRCQGWQLCQVLRHETTAAYYVCSSLSDPRQAVALDACSDYRRNESVLLPVDELLTGLIPLPTGGSRVSEEIELCYRFAKAAAKDKNPAKALEEFLHYSSAARVACETWLQRDWKIALERWDGEAVTAALSALRARLAKRPPLSNVRSLRRMIGRVLRPSGLIVVAPGLGEEQIADLRETFDRLHFRRFQRSSGWRPSLIKGLITSTLIVVPGIGGFISAWLPKDLLFYRDPSLESARVRRDLAHHLHVRCMRRERLGA